jgi:PKHD-type hydroxylase
MDASLNEESGLFVYPHQVDIGVCKRIIRLAHNKWEASEVESDLGSDELDTSLRKSGVFWTKEEWLVALIWSYMDAYNEVSGLSYDIRSVEPIQLTRYGKGGFYDFHVDGFGSKKWEVGGSVRKLSMTIQLSEDYDGGEFEVVRCRKGEVEVDTMDKSMGTVILFPSVLEHRVLPVTRGVRYSLVAWFTGPAFR